MKNDVAAVLTYLDHSYDHVRKLGHKRTGRARSVSQAASNINVNDDAMNATLTYDEWRTGRSNRLIRFHSGWQLYVGR